MNTPLLFKYRGKASWLFLLLLGTVLPFFGYSQAPNPVNYEIANGAVSEVLLKRYLARSLFITEFLDITPLTPAITSCYSYADKKDPQEYNRWLKFIRENHPKIILGMTGLWGWNRELYTTCGNLYFPKCSTAVAAVHQIDPQIICEGTLDEWVNPFLTANNSFYRFPIPEYVKIDLNLSSPSGTCFEADQIRITDNTDYTPDISKNQTIAWYYFIGTQLIDAGCESLRVGTAGALGTDDRAQGNRQLWRLTSALRRYAATHARRRFVLISGGTPEPYYSPNYPTIGNQIIFDFQTSGLNSIQVMEASRGELAYGDGLTSSGANLHDYSVVFNAGPNLPHSILGKTPAGIAPQGWSTTGSPFIVEMDNSGPATWCGTAPTTACPTEFGFPWAWDESTWFSKQSELYRNNWLKYAWHRVQCLDNHGYLAFNGRRPTSWQDGATSQAGWYRAYNTDPQFPALIGGNQEAIIRLLWDGQEPGSTTSSRWTWTGDFQVLRTTSIATITGRKNYGDFNGDGILDILETADKSRNESWAGWRIYLYNVSNGTYELKTSGGSSPSWGETIYVGDFSGDDKDDIVYTADKQQGISWQGWKINTAVVDASGNPVLVPSSSGSFPSWGEKITVGRFDSDNRDDFLVTTNWRTNPGGPAGLAVLTAASGFTNTTGVTLSTNGPAGKGELLYVGDFSGDNRDDLLVTGDIEAAPSSTWNGYRIYHNLSTSSTSFVQKAYGSWPSWGEDFVLGDWNQDGNCDFTVTASPRFATGWQGSNTYLSNATGNHFINVFQDDDVSYSTLRSLVSHRNTVTNQQNLDAIGKDSFLTTFIPAYCSGLYYRTTMSGQPSSSVPLAQQVTLSAREHIIITPNPGQESFVVQLPKAIQETSFHLTLQDATGRVVWTRDVGSANNGTLPVNVGSHPTGLYMLRVEGHHGYHAVRRLAIQ